MIPELFEPPRVGPLEPPDRLLMGPGPSDVHPRVLKAMSTTLIGHLDPAFVQMMNEVQELLRYTFRTRNRWTIPVSGTGSAAMEAAFTNLVEPGDVVAVPSNGYFGDRMASMVERAGGIVVRVNAPWGEPLDPAQVQAAIGEHVQEHRVLAGGAGNGDAQIRLRLGEMKEQTGKILAYILLLFCHKLGLCLSLFFMKVLILS